MSVIYTFDIKACRKTSLNWFFGGFLKFKISKRPRLLCLGPCKDQDHSPVFIWSSSVQSPIFYQRLDLETLLLVLWQAFGASNQLGLNKSHDHVVIFFSFIMLLEAEAMLGQVGKYSEIINNGQRKYILCAEIFFLCAETFFLCAETFSTPENIFFSPQKKK